ncbi:MAG: dienelactone hydrolase family protein [Prosthecobacter sp.]|uniref:dienelactone hydrolase family protein n=1 Tax=Prosthecobacter sp. TaxID=1965333 RepID=UPI0025FF387B|nr:dienelactone hydrolase family protein [Prosthecobacter sp.]MCF7787444.1 dienelactone hydrolase family protein [Prosthecobacter sp.]
MKTNRALLFISTLFLSTSLLKAEIKETVVDYTSGGVVCEGLHVVDTAKTGKLPSVLIIHQWTGLSDNEKMRAHMLAELGYNVFAADIYGKGVRPQPPEAGKEAGKYKSDRKLYRERMLSALEVLSKDPHTDASKIAAIGYCFGGTGVIELARSGALIKGVVSFHGGLDSPTPADGKNIKGKVLALHGADDPFVPAKDIAAFEQEMKDAKVDYKLVSYPGAVHAFTQKGAGNDNSKGAAYNEAADKASWEEMKAFFARIFKTEG